MRLLPNPDFGEAGEILVSTINSSGAIDLETGFIDIDNIWVSPKYRKDLISVIEMSLSLSISSFTPARTILLSPDNLRRPFGLIPVVAYVAETLGAYMGVWKEAADFTTGLSKLYGPTGMPLDCFILQDVISTGGTLLKMAPTLKKSEWNLKAYICLVLARPFSERIKENLEQLRTMMQSTPDPIPFYYVVQLLPDSS
jgi:hypothetical protein